MNKAAMSGAERTRRWRETKAAREWWKEQENRRKKLSQKRNKMYKVQNAANSLTLENFQNHIEYLIKSLKETSTNISMLVDRAEKMDPNMRLRGLPRAELVLAMKCLVDSMKRMESLVRDDIVRPVNSILPEMRSAD